MYKPNSNGGDSEQTGSLITPASASGRYTRLWKRGICVGIFISLNKSPITTRISDTALPLNASSDSIDRASSASSQHVIDVLSDDATQFVEEDNRLDPETLSRIVRGKALNTLVKRGGVVRVASLFGSDLVSGKPGNIDPEARRNSASNSGGAPALFRFLRLLWAAFNRFTIYLLLISAGLSFAADTLEEGPKYGWVDGSTVLFAVLILVVCPSVMQFIRERRLRKKNANAGMSSEIIDVVRNGETQPIAVSDITVGDIVQLKKGDRIPADGLFFSGDGLKLDDVLDSDIDSDRNPFLFSGAMVIDGSGRMIVTAIATNLAPGDEESKEPTLLQAKIEKPNNYADKLALCMAVLITLVILLHTVCKRKTTHGGVDNGGLPELRGKVSVQELMRLFKKVLVKPRSFVSILTISLTVVVLGIQHGVSLVITDSLSRWNDRLVSVFPQNLSAFSTFGFVSIICIDVSSGMLCSDPVELDKCFIGEREINHDEDDSNISQVVVQVIREGVGAARLVPGYLRSSIDVLLDSWMDLKWGTHLELAIENSTSSRLLDNKCCGILVRKKGDDEKCMHLHWHGAARPILQMCSHYYDCGGESLGLESQRRKFEQVIGAMEEGGLRPIAFAYKPTEDQEIKEEGLILSAVVGFRYSVGETPRSTMQALLQAGMSVKLVSQDEVGTAEAIGCDLGIFRPDSNEISLEGEKFRKLNPEGRRKMIDQITVLGRCLPEDKLLMVQCLKQNGHVVVFYGGLTTADTPALKEADVAITEQTISTQVARECSDIVICSGGFSNSLIHLLKYGTRAYRNIPKFVQLQLTLCISGVLITSITTMHSGDSPITPIQLIWVNFMMCVLGWAIMVIGFPGDGYHLLVHQPKPNRTDPLLTISMWGNLLTQVLYQNAVMLSFWFKGQSTGPGTKKNLEIFNIFALCQVFNQFSVMELEKKEALVEAFRHYRFLAAVGAVVALQVLVMEFVMDWLDYTRLNWQMWALCFLLAALSWVFDRALKFIWASLPKWPVQRTSSPMGYEVMMPLLYASPLLYVSSAGLLPSLYASPLLYVSSAGKM